MKVARDLFLWSIGNFLEKIQEPKLAEKVHSKISTEIKIKKKYANDFCMYKAMKMYLKENKELKSYLENLTNLLMEEHSEESEDEKESKKKSKPVEVEITKEKVKETKSKDLLGKKRKKSSSTDKLSHDEDYKMKEKSKEKKKERKQTEESDFDIDPQKMRIKKGLDVDPSILNKKNAPFRRINEDDYKITNDKLKNNSWAEYAKITGNDFGIHANERLAPTRGKDFKKEKSKFKNKSGFGGTVLSTEVKSIKLKDDSDSD